MDRESLYGSRVRYEEHLCLAPGELYALQASLSHQTTRDRWRTRWLDRVKNLMSQRTVQRDGLMSGPAHESAYNTWLCLRARGERL